MVLAVTASTVDPELVRLDLRSIDEETAGERLAVLHPIDEVEKEDLPQLSLDRIAPDRHFALLHDAFRLAIVPPPGAILASPQSRVVPDRYQLVPAARALALPRARLLIADDVGLGKTIEAGIVYRELARRRRAHRVLIVTPAGICTQWRQELLEKFGIEFEIFDRDAVEQRRRELEIGTNPWTVTRRVIVSLDFAKLDGAFRELSGTQWDLAIVDEAHHVAQGDDEEKTLNRRFAEWLADKTDSLLLLSATPHDGSDASFASLLRLCDPVAAPPGLALDYARFGRYVVRRLKGAVTNSDGSPKFIPRDPVRSIAITLTPLERRLHEAVHDEVRRLREAAVAAKSPLERTMLDFLGTILRKRAASSRAALRATLQTRRETLAEDLRDVDVRRDLLRRARAEESLTEEERRLLERDLHGRSLHAARRALTRERSAAERESAAYDEIERSLNELNATPDPKTDAVIAFLEALWREDPDENVLIFSEFIDTVEALAGTEPVGPVRARFGDRVLVLHGESEHRDALLQRFTRERGLLLVCTDVASEGLNLQDHCRTLLHVDLPWNPNRLEQRNGRIDRFGQTRAPRIAYLYAEQTYDGELLNRLLQKLEMQLRTLRSVGDVLGSFQTERLERLLADLPADEPFALRDVEARIDDIFAREVPSALREVTERKADDGIGEFDRATPSLAEFVRAAVALFDGSARIEGAHLLVERAPAAWSLQSEAHIFALAGCADKDLPVLSSSSEIARAAIRAVRETRFDLRRDPRVARRTTAAVSEPTLVCTFLVEARSADGEILERLTACAVAAGGVVPDGEHLLDATASGRDADVAAARSLFAAQWEAARSTALTQAQVEVHKWMQSLVDSRIRENARYRKELAEWYEGSVAALDATAQGQLMLELEIPRTSAGRKRLQNRYERHVRLLDEREQIELRSVESLGVLLLIPEPLAS